MAKSEILQPFILSWEGGWSNKKNDRGGATMKGVTIATWRIHGYDNDGDRDRDERDLRLITNEQWHDIFKKVYWDKWHADEILDQSVANLLVDWYWMSGRYAVTIPQALLGVKVDGLVGSKTIAAINGYSGGQSELFRALWSDRRAYFNMLARKPGQGVFLKGWLNRLNGVKYGRLVCNRGKTIYF